MEVRGEIYDIRRILFKMCMLALRVVWPRYYVALWTTYHSFVFKKAVSQYNIIIYIVMAQDPCKKCKKRVPKILALLLKTRQDTVLQEKRKIYNISGKFLHCLSVVSGNCLAINKTSIWKKSCMQDIRQDLLTQKIGKTPRLAYFLLTPRKM